MKCQRLFCLALLSLPTLDSTVVLAGQSPPDAEPGPYARIVVIEPKPGQAEAFEAGYERHIRWHREQQDPWTWYGWSFVFGERLGLFMDGTFGHAARDFDAAVQPAADAADNARNVTPHANFLSHAVYQRLDAFSNGAPLPDTSPFLALTTYAVAPGREWEFEAVLRGCRARADDARFTWFKLRIGGTHAQYLLFRPAESLAAAAGLKEFCGTAMAHQSGEGGVENVRSELLRYRPTLSYHP